MAQERPERRLLFDFFIHEIENLHNRVDWFLIFHGILFEAFVAAHYFAHRITLGVLGCVVSYVWLVAGIRQLWNFKHLVSSIADDGIMGGETGQLFTKLLEAREAFQPLWMKWARATPAFGIILPSAVLIAWLVVTTTYTENGFSAIALAIVIGTLVLLTVSWRFVRGPKPPSGAVAHLRPENTSSKHDSRNTS
ncbi:MAG TPA: hypothetical protein VNX26_11265 [Candidatus Acidoferrum sp.]|jgi:hypothetical protein|nr:hypothetical protein [Candidatus Acidoferrum sp.]